MNTAYDHNIEPSHEPSKSNMAGGAVPTEVHEKYTTCAGRRGSPRESTFEQQPFYSQGTDEQEVQLAAVLEARTYLHAEVKQ